MTKAERNKLAAKRIPAGFQIRSIPFYENPEGRKWEVTDKQGRVYESAGTFYGDEQETPQEAAEIWARVAIHKGTYKNVQRSGR